jgi:hypothetical protein
MLVKEMPDGFKEVAAKYGPYSPSRLITARCPQRFFGQYVRGDRNVGSSIAAARGNAIHEVCALITEARVKGVALTPRMVDQWVSEAIGRNPASYEQADLIKAAANGYVSNPSPYVNSTTKCEAALGIRLFEEELLDPSITPRRLFLSSPYKRGEKTGAFFGGTVDEVSLDEVTNTITIVDRKSTPTANVNEDHNFQLGCYAWLVHVFYPTAKIRTVLHYVHPSLNFYAPPQYWGAEELQDIENYVFTRIFALENFAEFPALPGNHCDYCHMVQQCPENLKLEEQQARGTVDLNVRGVEDLKRLATQLHVTGRLYDDIQKNLKKGLEKFGIQNSGIAIEGSWYGYKTSDEAVDWAATDLEIRNKAAHAQSQLDAGQLDGDAMAKAKLMSQLENLDDVLKHYGVDPGAFKTWQGQKLKNLWKLDKPDLMDLLKEYIVKDKSTRFGKHKL